jgi:hypothetical protein
MNRIIYRLSTLQKRSKMNRDETELFERKKEKNNMAHNIRISKKACFWLLVCVVVVAVSSVPYAFCFPPAGSDYLPSTTANIQLQILGPSGFTETIVANGPTNITRGTPYNPGNGRMKIDTEIVLMTLTGTSAHIGPITITESPYNASTGAIQQDTAGVDFPAYSYFDVYVEIHTSLSFPLAVLHNNAAEQMNSTIYSIPPWGAVYVSPTTPIPLIDQSGNIVGYILRCYHDVGPSSVGGTVLPTDKFALLGLLLAPYVPYVGLASTAIIGVAVTIAIYSKRVKRRKEKQ